MRLFLLFVLPVVCYGLDNGLARTPPMGWMSWERFRCNIDCETYPEDCISERLFREMADMLVKEGYSDAGYEYIIIDDCWLDHKRGTDGKLKPDPTRFPSGIPALSKHVHYKGLKFGIYEDYGNFTCGGYPGVLGHMQTDAATFAEWEVDYVKLDGCYSDPSTMIEGYPEFGRHLNQSGRPIVYSCSWPAYQVNDHPNYTAIAQHCNLWRNFDDISDSWDSVLTIIDFYAGNKDGFVDVAGPGKWNDPDMLIIGNFGLSFDQSEAQMGIWCLMAAPLIMSNDLRKMRPEFKAILQNKDAIKIDQDPLGIQGKRIYKQNDIEIYAKPIMPSYQGHNSLAFGVLNRWTEGTPIRVKVTLKSLGLSNVGGYSAKDVFSGDALGVFSPAETITLDVNPTGIRFIRLDVLAGIRYTPPQTRWRWNSEDRSWMATLQDRMPASSHQDQGICTVKQGLTGWKN